MLRSCNLPPINWHKLRLMFKPRPVLARGDWRWLLACLNGSPSAASSLAAMPTPLVLDPQHDIELPVYRSRLQADHDAPALGELDRVAQQSWPAPA
ncbi:hypothetical protein PPS11_26214 [Pseudomonas putida S11]|nr:hypothetical protein PPS11_26214 [Pseudomonas putida S11]